MREVQYCRQLRWHKKHLRTVTGKINADEYTQLREICKRRQTTPYAVMSQLARDFIRQGRKALPQSDDIIQAGRL